MTRMLALSCLLFLPLSLAVAADNEEVIVLSLQVSSDGKPVSEPRVALLPGTDASVMQSFDGQGLDDDLVLNVVFHSVHALEEAAEMLIDADFGPGQPDHLSASHVKMRWGEPYPLSFRVAEDAPLIEITVTPTRAERSELMLGRK